MPKEDESCHDGCQCDPLADAWPRHGARLWLPVLRQENAHAAQIMRGTR